jgi:hypothetical protein
VREEGAIPLLICIFKFMIIEPKRGVSEFAGKRLYKKKIFLPLSRPRKCCSESDALVCPCLYRSLQSLYS